MQVQQGNSDLYRSAQKGAQTSHMRGFWRVNTGLWMQLISNQGELGSVCSTRNTSEEHLAFFTQQKLIVDSQLTQEQF